MPIMPWLCRVMLLDRCIFRLRVAQQKDFDLLQQEARVFLRDHEAHDVNIESHCSVNSRLFIYLFIITSYLRYKNNMLKC